MPRRAIKQTPDEKEEVELSEFLKTIGESEVVVKLFRIDKHGRHKYLEVLPIEVVQSGSLEEMIREDHPEGGSFLIRVLKAGKFIKGGNKMIHIEPENGAMVPYDAGGSGGDMQFQLMKMQMDMQKDSAERQMTMMSSFNTSIMGLMTAIMQNNKPMDPATIIALMKGSDGNSGLAMMKDAISVVKELGGGVDAGKEDPMMAVATSAVNRLIDKTMGGPAAQPAAPNPPAQLPPATQGAPPAVTAEAGKPAEPAAPAGDQPSPEMKARLDLLAELKQAAKISKPGELDDDVDFWAEYLERFEDLKPQCKWILAVVREYSWQEVQAGLSRVDQEVSTEPYATFFKRLYEVLREPAEEKAAS